MRQDLLYRQIYMSLTRELDCVTNFMVQSKEFRTLYEYVWMRMYSEYLNSRSSKANLLQRANLKLPYAWTIIETFTPQIIDAFMGQAPYIKANPRKESNYELMQALSDMSDSITEHFTYQLDRMKFFDDFTTFVKNTLIYGTGIAKLGWTKNEKILPARQKTMLDGIEVMKKVEQPVTLYEGPIFSNVDIIDFFPDWGATKPGDIQSMRGCVHRVYRTMEDLRKLEKTENGGIYINLDELKLDVDKYGYNAWNNAPATNVDWPQSYKAYAVNQWPGQKLKGKVEVWEYWGQFQEIDGTFKEKVITVANGRTVIRVDDNPYDYGYKPFIGCVDQPVPGEFYGTGELEPLYSLFKEASALRNARLDQTNQAVNRMFIVDRNSGINIRNLYSRTSGIILANDVNGIRMMDVPEVPNSSYREIQQIDYEIQNASAMVNASQGVSNLGEAFGNTAKGVSYIEGTMNSRIGLKVKIIENMVMRELGKRLACLNRQFLDPELWNKIHGNVPNPFEILSAEDFYNCWEFTCVGAIERLNRSSRQAQFSQAIIPYLQFVERTRLGTINFDNLTKTFFQEFQIQNPLSYINPPEVQKQIQQQQAQQQMAAQAQAHDEKTKTLATVEAIKGGMKQERDAQNNKTKIITSLIKGGFDVAGNSGR